MNIFQKLKEAGYMTDGLTSPIKKKIDPPKGKKNTKGKNIDPGFHTNLGSKDKDIDPGFTANSLPAQGKDIDPGFTANFGGLMDSTKEKKEKPKKAKTKISTFEKNIIPF